MNWITVLDDLAKKYSNGHFAVIRSNVDWKVGFNEDGEHICIGSKYICVGSGSTFPEAVGKAVEELIDLRDKKGVKSD